MAGVPLSSTIRLAQHGQREALGVLLGWGFPGNLTRFPWNG